jgi:hypothetical protein
VIGTAYVLAWLRAFAVTQLVEVPVYTRVCRATRAQAFGASLVTHPILWFVIFPHLHASYLGKCVAGELFAWLVEAAYLRALRIEPRWPRALLCSLAANGASVAVGLLLRALTGYP